MNKKEQQQCDEYRSELERSRRRLAELEERGIDAMSRYDIEIAHGGDADQALKTAKYLVGNHVRYFGEKVEVCDGIPKQAPLFDVSELGPAGK